jgi:hypothetical protein
LLDFRGLDKPAPRGCTGAAQRKEITFHNHLGGNHRQFASTIKVDDTSYDLNVGACKCCGEPRYRLMRCNGASFSVYEISSADCENLEEYVAELHSVLAVDVETKLTVLREIIAERNSRGFFETEGMGPFRVGLIDKARIHFQRRD